MRLYETMTLAEALRMLDRLKKNNSSDYFKVFEAVKRDFNTHYDRIVYYSSQGHTMMHFDYHMLALAYAEKYGVIEYHISNNTMIYYESWKSEKTTYKCIVNLDTYKETRTPLKHYYKPYNSLISGKYQANMPY